MPHKPTVHPNTNLCVIYFRVSSTKQATDYKNSLPGQEARCREKAEQDGLTVLRVVKEPESAWVLEKRLHFQGCAR